MNQLTDSYTLHNGVQIPCVGFGTWKTPDGDVAENSVRTAIEAGYRHIDTATIYGNEASVSPSRFRRATSPLHECRRRS